MSLFPKKLLLILDDLDEESACVVVLNNIGGLLEADKSLLRSQLHRKDPSLLRVLRTFISDKDPTALLNDLREIAKRVAESGGTKQPIAGFTFDPKVPECDDQATFDNNIAENDICYDAPQTDICVQAKWEQPSEAPHEALSPAAEEASESPEPTEMCSLLYTTPYDFLRHTQDTEQRLKDSDAEFQSSLQESRAFLEKLPPIQTLRLADRAVVTLSQPPALSCKHGPQRDCLPRSGPIVSGCYTARNVTVAQTPAPGLLARPQLPAKGLPTVLEPTVPLVAGTTNRGAEMKKKRLTIEPIMLNPSINSISPPSQSPVGPHITPQIWEGSQGGQPTPEGKMSKRGRPATPCQDALRRLKESGSGDKSSHGLSPRDNFDDPPKVSLESEKPIDHSHREGESSTALKTADWLREYTTKGATAQSRANDSLALSTKSLFRYADCEVLLQELYDASKTDNDRIACNDILAALRAALTASLHKDRLMSNEIVAASSIFDELSAGTTGFLHFADVVGALSIFSKGQLANKIELTFRYLDEAHVGISLEGLTSYLNSVFKALLGHVPNPARSSGLTAEEMGKCAAVQCFEECHLSADQRLSAADFVDWFTAQGKSLTASNAKLPDNGLQEQSFRTVGHLPPNAPTSEDAHSCPSFTTGLCASQKKEEETSSILSSSLDLDEILNPPHSKSHKTHSKDNLLTNGTTQGYAPGSLDTIKNVLQSAQMTLSYSQVIQAPPRPSADASVPHVPTPAQSPATISASHVRTPKLPLQHELQPFVDNTASVSREPTLTYGNSKAGFVGSQAPVLTPGFPHTVTSALGKGTAQGSAMPLKSPCTIRSKENVPRPKPLNFRPNLI